MANYKNRRILYRDVEERITDKAVEFHKSAQDGISNVKDYAHEKNDEFIAMANEYADPFIQGLFLGGFALGTLLARGSE